MSGETDLQKLISSMSPQLKEGEYVFLTVQGSYGDYSELEPLASFREIEGLTLIVPADRAADAGWKDEPPFRMITLNVHSSLNAVGLTAAVSSKLAEDGISANVVAAFYHDHIFVQASLAERALESLKELSGMP
ncbi:MAG: ACT domain-containing protein [Spirochaetales bacterium]|nr:ACT domain-containing protein [Spirochaetales bacterium]